MFRFAGSSVQSLGRDDLVDLYLEIRPKIERVIARRTGSLTFAADLAQEMFFKIDKITAVIPSRLDAERYFMRAAVNASLDHLKIEARRRAFLKNASVMVMSATVPSVEGGLLARDDLRRIEEALAELTEKCRRVFILSRFHGFTHPQIAAQLGVSQSLVEKYVARALLHCQARVADRAD